MASPPWLQSAPCYFCAKKCLPAEYCHGCGQHVCLDCDEELPVGPHDVGDHRRFQLEDEDDGR